MGRAEEEIGEGELGFESLLEISAAGMGGGSYS